MDNLLPLDELNNLTTYLRATDLSEESEDDIADSVLDLLIIAYSNGVRHADNDLGVDIGVSLNEMQESIQKETKGKTFRDRIKEHFESNDIEGIIKVADTESHRVFNEASFTTAKKSGKEVYKVWNTMLDGNVRPDHTILEGVRVKLNERFYVGEDGALFPGGFESAELNVNCRCILDYETE